MASIPAYFSGDHLLLRFPERRSDNRLTVSTDSLADFSSIQDAIDHAASGDTIVIDAGVYIENLVITKPVHLVGPSDPRFVTDSIDPEDELPFALVIGTADAAIEWHAPGGSIQNLAISQIHTGQTSALVRQMAGRLEMQRCVVAHGEHVAVECRGGELTLERCHIRDVEIGVWASGGAVEMERTHVEGSDITAVSVESTARASMTECYLEGRTILTGQVDAFDGNDIDILFVGYPFTVGANRVSSMVHLCQFRVTEELTVSR